MARLELFLYGQRRLSKEYISSDDARHMQRAEDGPQARPFIIAKLLRQDAHDAAAKLPL